MLIILASCNSGTSTKETATTETAGTKEQMFTCPDHKDEHGHKGDKCPDCGKPMTVPITETATETTTESNAPKTGSVKEIIADYLKMKNAFTVDDSKSAADAGKNLENDFKNFNQDNLSAEQKKLYADIEDDAREHAEHIAANGGNIEHQREHFETLSNDIFDLVKGIKTGQTLYKDFCPMYNKGKGAFWVSETKAIANPYLGKSMPKCGSMKEEIK